MSKVTILSKPNRIVIASKGVQGPPGPEGIQGIQGIQGEKGDTGDVTPEALAARDAAVGAASAAAGSAATAGADAATATDKAAEAAASAELAEQARLLGASIGFATKADMDASLAHPDGTLALVTNDPDPANSVTYRKTGASGSGSWVQAADRVTGLEGRVSAAEVEIDEHQEKLAGQFIRTPDDILLVLDSDGFITIRQAADGGLHLPGMETSVQEAVTDSVSDYTAANRLVDFEDESGRLVGGVLRDGEVFTPQHPSGVGRMLQRYTAKPLSDRRLFLQEDAAALIDELGRMNAMVASPPNALLPQKYTVRDSIIDDLTLPGQTEYTPIDTPYGVNDRVVHPYVIEFRVPFRGYRYLMCINPYSAEIFENPVIYGGNNLSEWELLDGFHQPLDVPPRSGDDWNSDSGFTYDPTDGALVCFWRRSTRVGDSFSQIFAKKTWDGFVWTDTFQVAEADADPKSSPALLYNPARGVWMMWSASEPGMLVLRESQSLDEGWSVVSTQAISGLWHFEVKYLGGKFLMLINKRDPDSHYRLAISGDGVSWTDGQIMLGPPEEALYKASFLPVLNEDQIALDVMWTTNHHSTDDLRRRLFVARTNFTSI